MFSQYVETLEVLRKIIEIELDKSVLVYHGGLGQKERDNYVRDFQEGGARLMLISLKAVVRGLTSPQQAALSIMTFGSIRQWSPKQAIAHIESVKSEMCSFIDS